MDHDDQGEDNLRVIQIQIQSHIQIQIQSKATVGKEAGAGFWVEIMFYHLYGWHRLGLGGNGRRGGGRGVDDWDDDGG